MHHTIWYVVIFCHQDDVCKHYIGSLYVGGYGGLSKNGPCSFHKLYQNYFLVVDKCSGVTCMLIVVMMCRWSDDIAC